MPLRTILITATRSGTASTVIIRRGASGTGTGGGVTDHGALTGREDDDHTQYFNQTRGDARYAPIASPTFTGNATADQFNTFEGAAYSTSGIQFLAGAGPGNVSYNVNFSAGDPTATRNMALPDANGTLAVTSRSDGKIVATDIFGILPITSGGTGAANLDALQPKITSLNASAIRTDLGLGVGQSPTFAGQTLTAPLQISGSATIGGVGQSLFNFSADGAGRIFGTSGNTPFLHVRQSTGKFVRIGPTSISYGTTGTIPTMNLTMDGGVFAFDAAIESTTATAGLILKSPDGTRYRVTVANGGALTTTLLT